MNDTGHILNRINQLLTDFTSESAYQNAHNLTRTGQNLCYQMQANLVNSGHIMGDALQADEPAIRKLGLSIGIKNLQVFVEATAAARELSLIKPDQLVSYQDRAESLIKDIQVLQTSGTT